MSQLRTVCILSRGRKLYSTRRLVEACVQRGLQVDVINPSRCYMRISPGLFEMHYRGRALPHYQCVIPRIGVSITRYGTAVLRQLQSSGCMPLNTPTSILNSRDKLLSLQLLAIHENVGIPITVFGDNPDDTSDLLKMIGRPPHVIKLVEGTQGNGVVLAEKMGSSRSVIEAFRGINANFLVQEFIAESKGSDIRAFVVGNRVVASMKRQAKGDEFRSNLHRGGSAEAVELSELEKFTACKAASIVGLDVAGVDMLRSDSGPLVLEVNSSPGLEGIESSTGVDVAGEILDYAVAKYREYSTSGVGA